MNYSKYFREYTILLVLLFLTKGLMSQNILIPKPQKIEVHQGVFRLGSAISIKHDNKSFEVDYLAAQLRTIANLEVITGSKEGSIKIAIDSIKESTHEESYKLLINQNGVEITAPTNRGVFYGIQTLLQLIEEHKASRTLPYLRIADEPKLDYRGIMLDVGRHFFNVQEVKQFLDYLAAYKYNKFHWHLTEDQGWRIEIKKYPLLTKIGAWRDETQIGRYFDYNQYDKERYGGYYTQEEIKEVVAYAKRLHIDIIPEIEMPGHAQAAIAAYPELGCIDKPIKVMTRWGVSQNIYCPKEVTFQFLEDVIDEVVQLFPYEYIHIGGDEAAKEQWRESSFVQNLIEKLGLKNEEEMQSYFITRMEKYINSKGKRIIGWDEILQGGLAPNATVMSWRGESGGIAAAKSGHRAIMTPASTNYFDYYQGNPATEPLAWGGNLPLKKVYRYNPIPNSLSPEQKKLIWGTQGNVWTEYISDFAHVQYMMFPRMMALAEVAWGTSEPHNYENFENRVIRHFDILDRKGIHYSRAIFEVEGKPLIKDNHLFYQLTSGGGLKDIRYTKDGSEPTFRSQKYELPISINKNMTIKAATFKGTEKIGLTTKQRFRFSKSTGKNVLVTGASDNVKYKLEYVGLVDGVEGQLENHRVNWVELASTDVSITIDLGQNTQVNQVSFSLLNLPDWDVFFPALVEVYFSSNGREYKKIAQISKREIENSVGRINLSFSESKARNVKIKFKNSEEKGMGENKKTKRILIDEIAVF